MQKVRKTMERSKKYPLAGFDHLDEFTVGEKEVGKQGKNYDNKKEKAAIAVELIDRHKVK